MHVLNKLPVSGPFYVCLIPISISFSSKIYLLLAKLSLSSIIYLHQICFLSANFSAFLFSTLLFRPNTSMQYSLPFFVVAPSLSLVKQFVSQSRKNITDATINHQYFLLKEPRLHPNIGRSFKFVFQIGHKGSTYRRRYLKRCGD